MKKWRKYLLLGNLHIQTQLAYRGELLTYRLRSFIGFVTVIMIWQAVFAQSEQDVALQGYQQAELFSYLIFGNLFRSIARSQWADNLQGTISQGDLNLFLIQPLNIFAYTLTQEFADKVFDISLRLVEIALIFFLFQPELKINFSATHLIALSAMIPLVFALNFLMSCLISFSTFWYYQNGGWGQRFLADLLIDFFSGAYFPLEFLPVFLTKALIILPTSLLYYVPMQIYLGRLSGPEILTAMAYGVGWIIFLFILNRWLWFKGLRAYEAFGG